MGHGGGPNVCATTPSLGNVGGGSSSAPTGASCAPADFGRQTLSPSEVDKRSGKRKSDSSGKREEYEKKKTASAVLLPYVYYCNPCEYLGVQRKYMKYFYIKINMDFED